MRRPTKDWEHPKPGYWIRYSYAAYIEGRKPVEQEDRPFLLEVVRVDPTRDDPVHWLAIVEGRKVGRVDTSYVDALLLAEDTTLDELQDLDRRSGLEAPAPNGVEAESPAGGHQVQVSEGSETDPPPTLGEDPIERTRRLTGAFRAIDEALDAVPGLQRPPAPRELKGPGGHVRLVGGPYPWSAVFELTPLGAAELVRARQHPDELLEDRKAPGAPMPPGAF